MKTVQSFQTPNWPSSHLHLSEFSTSLHIKKEKKRESIDPKAQEMSPRSKELGPGARFSKAPITFRARKGFLCLPCLNSRLKFQ